MINRKGKRGAETDGTATLVARVESGMQLQKVLKVMIEEGTADTAYATRNLASIKAVRKDVDDRIELLKNGADAAERSLAILRDFKQAQDAFNAKRDHVEFTKASAVKLKNLAGQYLEQLSAGYVVKGVDESALRALQVQCEALSQPMSRTQYTKMVQAITQNMQRLDFSIQQNVAQLGRIQEQCQRDISVLQATRKPCDEAILQLQGGEQQALKSAIDAQIALQKELKDYLDNPNFTTSSQNIALAQELHDQLSRSITSTQLDLAAQIQNKKARITPETTERLEKTMSAIESAHRTFKSNKGQGRLGQIFERATQSDKGAVACLKEQSNWLSFLSEQTRASQASVALEEGAEVRGRNRSGGMSMTRK